MSTEMRPTRETRTLWMAIVLYAAIGVGLALLTWRFGRSGLLPRHIGMGGVVDGWWDREQLAGQIWLSTGCGVLAATVLMLFYPDPRPARAPSRSLGVTIALVTFGIEVLVCFGLGFLRA